MALRLDETTRDRLEALAQRLEVPKTVLARRMLNQRLDETWALLEERDRDD